MKNILFALFLFFPCITFAAPTTDGESKNSVAIGALIPLSGDYAPVGDDNRKGIELALAESGENSSVSVVFGDSRTDPKTAINELRKMVRTDGVLGAFAMRSPIGMAVNPVSKSLQIPILGGVGHSDFPKQNGYAWQMWSPSDYEGGGLLSLVRCIRKESESLRW